MNKRANLFLNIYGIIAFFLAFTSIGLSVTLGELSFKVFPFIRICSFFIGVISGLLFISIELFLFILMKVKAKIMTIFYILVSILGTLIVNKYIPFSGFIVYMFFLLVKDVLRVLLVERIYIPKEFDYYCKMFHIKIKDFPKPRKKALVEKNSVVEVEKDMETKKRKKVLAKVVPEETTI